MYYAPIVKELLEKKTGELARQLAKVDPSATIRQGIEIAKSLGAGSILVIDDSDKLVRLVTNSNLRDAWLEGSNLDDPIASIGIPGDKIRTVDVSRNTYECLAFFARNYGHLPVTEEGKIVGLLTKGDVLFSLFGDGFRQSMTMEGRMPPGE